MRNPFKQFVSQYLSFSKSDRNAILILSTLILIVIIANIIVSNLGHKSTCDTSGYTKLMDEWDNVIAGKDRQIQSLFIFNPNTISKDKLDLLQIPVFIKRNILNYRKAGGKFSSAEDMRKIYGVNDSIYKEVESYIIIEKENTPKKTFRIKAKKGLEGYFDPNKVGFAELKRFGFNNFQTNNLLKYRKKGGVFKESIDLQKIYGIDSAFYSIIKKHIQIEKKISVLQVKPKPLIVHVELNNADSSALVKLKGIGPVYASRIIKYRDLLGGFFAKKQLLEVYNFPEETFHNIKNNISIDTTLINKIRINFIEYPALLRHPYLNKKQVGAILAFRKDNGNIEDVSQIRSIELIDSATFVKIRHYFTCR